MDGYDKPKRKRGERNPRIDFVTALTVEQCVERLERGPAHTLDYRLTVRTDQDCFIVEAWGQFFPERPLVTAQIDGYLDCTPNGTTRVSGDFTEKKPYDKTWFTFIVQMILFVLCGFTVINVKEASGRPVIIIFYLAFSGFTLGYLYYQAVRFQKQTPNLRQWLYDLLYVPPNQGAP